MKKILLALVLALGLAAPALASVCTCTGTCNLTTATWTCPGDADGIPDADDGVVCNTGCNLTIPPGTYTNNYFSVRSTGTATVTGTVIWNFDGPPLNTGAGFGADVFFAVGYNGSNRGTFLSNGRDLTINWIGSGTAIMALGTAGYGYGSDYSATSYTSVTMRGVERASTAVASYSRGATAPSPDTNMVDCLTGQTAPTSGALSDTIAFTTGKSQSFWYEVTCYPDHCTGAGTADAGYPAACCSDANATTECSATACGGGVCDYQITRNSTGSTPGSVASSASWSSMALATQNAPFGAGGVAIQATPVDSDADGVANGDGTLPAVGDKFAVFKPVLIQGGTNPITNGISVSPFQGGYDWRYVEINKGSTQWDEDCLFSGGFPLAVIMDTGSRILSPEGAAEFINVHNFASLAWDQGYTHSNDFVRAQEPRRYRNIYIHDVDAFVGSTPCGGVNDTLGGGIRLYPDDGDQYFEDLTFDGLHIARWGSGSAIELPNDITGVTRINFNDALIHDWPGINGYGVNGYGVYHAAGTNDLFRGISIWNLGQNGRGATAIGNASGGVQGDGELAIYRAENAFIVNIDSNTNAYGGSGADFGGAFIPGSSIVGETTRGATLSNSYIKGVVGAASFGGRLLYNFIKDVAFEDDAAAPCVSVNRRAAIHAPVDAIGNVITRTAALSCMESAFAVNLDSASPYTDRTRKIISNLASNMDSDAAVPLAGLFIADAGVNPSRNIDLYNNIFDGRANTGDGTTAACAVLNGGTGFDGKLTAYYNQCLNWIATNSGFALFEAGDLDEGYNRFTNISTSPAVDGGNAATDVDSNFQDIFNDPWSNGYLQKCDSPDKARGPYGNPVGALRFGINSFNHFHPAVIPLMDADAFKLRYNWLSCGAAYQDAIPR